MNYPISVFIDTNIFDSCKYHLGNNSVLQILGKLVEDNKVNLYISNIVLKEAEKHIRNAIENTYRVLKATEKDIKKLISPTMLEDTAIKEYFQLLPIEGLDESALNKFHDYLKKTNTTILDNSGINLDQIVSDYFSNKPPFEKKEKKKNEFPDAIIIAKLKETFSEMNPIWIISEDKGFQKAFQGLKGFNSMDSLKALFDILNEHDANMKVIYDQVKGYFENIDEVNQIIKEVVVKLQNEELEVEGMDCDRSGYCEGFEYDEVYTEDISNTNLTLSSIDKISENTVIVSVLFSADISVSCSFDDIENSIWDSEENEYFFLQRGEVRELHNAEFECVLTLAVPEKNDNTNFQLEEISYELELDQYTRVDREFIEQEDPEIDARAEMMDTLEEYHKH